MVLSTAAILPKVSRTAGTWSAPVACAIRLHSPSSNRIFDQ